MPAVTDRHRDGRPDADGREQHHQPRELEHHVRQPLEKPEHDVLAAARLHLGQGDREDHGEHHDLEHLVASGGVEEARREGVLEHAGKRCLAAGQLLSLFGGDGREVHAITGTDEVHRQQAEAQRQGGDDLEVDDGAEGEPADLLQVLAVSRDADHQAREHERHHDRLDEAQEDG